MATREGNLELAEKVVTELRKRRLHITTVESCTGGALAYYITNIPGASEVMKDAAVTYSNAAKIASGIPRSVLNRYTVYSERTAIAMAAAGLKKSIWADIAVGITGSISRQDPNNPNSQPGTIYIGLKSRATSRSVKIEIASGKRVDAKDDIVEHALKLIFEVVKMARGGRGLVKAGL